MNAKTSIDSYVSEEALKLSGLFKTHAKINQSDFGDKFDIGTQGMVSQYLTGRRPLNIPAAVGFARGLGINIAEFSPRLATLIREAADYTGFSYNKELSAETAAVLKLMEPLSQYEQRRMADIIKAIATPTPLTDAQVEEKMPITQRKGKKPGTP